MNTLAVFLLGLLVTLLGCSSLRNTNSIKISYSKFEALNVGGMTAEEVRQALGTPDKTYYIGKENRIVEKSEKWQWIYEVKNLNKLYLYFESDVLVSKSWNVDEEDKESSVKNVFEYIKGNWVVVKEPMTNPHAAPNQCYLEDLKSGHLVKVNGNSKKVSEISAWVPAKNEKSIKEQLHMNVGKEFCIAEHCSKVTSPEAWKHNQCEWLEQMVAEQKK